MTHVLNSWQSKAAKDALKALLPFQTTLRRIKRSIRPYVTNPLNDEHLLGDALRQVSALRSQGFSLEGKTAVELGTGWKPILPFIYRMYGAAEIISVDLERLLDLTQARDAFHFIRQKLAKVQARTGELSFPDFNQIQVDLQSLSQVLSASKIDYRAPFNFLALNEESTDLVFSRTVLEHVPEKQLQAIFSRSIQVLRPGGVMCHTIDMSDHWEHVDKSISKANFLKYDGFAWSLTGMNPQNYQNRLRRYEYLDMIKQCGFEILFANGSPHPATRQALENMPLIPRYRGVALDELAVIDTIIIARKPLHQRRH